MTFNKKLYNCIHNNCIFIFLHKHKIEFQIKSFEIQTIQITYPTMNFYSDIIINDIIDNAPIEELTNNLQRFMSECRYVLTKYSISSIHHQYTSNILNDPRKIVAFHCLDHEFAMSNCPSVLMYRKCKVPDKNEIRYYILFTCTKRNFRGQGYASKLLDGFLERVREEKPKHPDYVIKTILSSLEKSVLFYESYGFKWTRECISKYPVLLEYEKYEDGKEYFIMELKEDI